MNWNGSPNGGGKHQVFFGSNASGLTAQQLSQIKFKNPAGSTGTYPATILSTGEIVPARWGELGRWSTTESGGYKNK